jgi:hypothetical protein
MYIFHRSEKERPQPAILLQDSRDCGILTCRPPFLQRFAGIKVPFYCLLQAGFDDVRNTGLQCGNSVVQSMFCPLVILWDVTPCSLVNSCFGGIRYVHFQGILKMRAAE